jgi:hypothetical protein
MGGVSNVACTGGREMHEQFWFKRFMKTSDFGYLNIGGRGTMKLISTM